MDEIKSKVYIQIDTQTRITRCEGGFTMGNIDNVAEWILVDEGEGDKYNLCQSMYFDPPLYTEDGIPQWKYMDGLTILRSLAEIEADRKAARMAAYAVNRNVSAGELITVNGQLYKAISNIPNGGYVIEGQNIIKTTYEAELLALQKGEQSWHLS